MQLSQYLLCVEQRHPEVLKLQAKHLGWLEEVLNIQRINHLRPPLAVELKFSKHLDVVRRNLG